MDFLDSSVFLLFFLFERTNQVLPNNIQNRISYCAGLDLNIYHMYDSILRLKCSISGEKCHLKSLVTVRFWMHHVSLSEIGQETGYTNLLNV